MWEHIPPIRCLKALDAVSRCKSITRAAAEENISQSAISQSINQLELMLQTQLLDRSSRPARLTEQGQQFHRVVSAAFAAVAREVEELKSLNTGAENVLTVSCNLGFATYWLMPRLMEFSRLYPHININVVTTYQGAAELTPGVDIAIRYGDGQWTDSGGDMLFSEVLIPTCSPQYLQGKKALQTAQAIAGEQLIHVEVDDSSWPNWSTYFNKQNVIIPSRATGNRFSNYVQAVQAALAGEGIMLGWQSVVGDLVSTGQLVALDATVTLSSGYYVLVARQSKTRWAAVEFKTWLKRAVNMQPVAR